MSAEPRKQLVRRWILEMWGGGKLELVDELTSAAYVYHAPGNVTVQGRDGLKQFVTVFRTAFPDLANTIQDQIAEGSKVVTRGTTRGTHRAALGELAATGRQVAVPWVMISRFDAEKITEEWEIYDQHDLLQQLGAIPGAATGGPTAETPVEA